MGMHASISAIEYHVPSERLGNEEIARLSPNWTPQKIHDKTGILERRIASTEECASDLAVLAAEKLFERSDVQRGEIDFLLFCTQSPDYALPTTACMLQDRLKLPTQIGALDFNLGCSGYIYGLGLAEGLILSGQARNVLLVTGDTYTRFLKPEDLGVRSIFGDAGTATLVRGVESDVPLIGPFVHGTDGQGAENLIYRRNGVRRTDASSECSGRDFLYMDGPEIFSFALQVVPKLVNDLLSRATVDRDQIDLYVFHQANEYMLRKLQAKLQIPDERFLVAMHDVGNTVSSTIPIALHRSRNDGRLKPGMRVMLVGFGVGYSWSATIFQETAGSI